MNKIAREKKKSEEFYFDLVDNTGIIQLSLENVARVEAMIHFNSTYAGNFVVPCKKLKEVLIDKKRISDEDYHNLLEEVVVTIDSENSTHLNSDGNGRREITQRIYKLRKADLVRYLRSPQETNYKLLRLIEEETTAVGKSSKGNARKSRRNTSFASKFCHYACFYMFENRAEQDNYSIYDSIVKKAIPQYADLYDVILIKKNLRDYVYYQTIIDEIIDRSGSKISRNGFDHLLWYCYK